MLPRSKSCAPNLFPTHCFCHWFFLESHSPVTVRTLCGRFVNFMVYRGFSHLSFPRSAVCHSRMAERGWLSLLLKKTDWKQVTWSKTHLVCLTKPETLFWVSWLAIELSRSVCSCPTQCWEYKHMQLCPYGDSNQGPRACRAALLHAELLPSPAKVNFQCGSN